VRRWRSCVLRCNRETDGEDADGQRPGGRVVGVGAAERGEQVGDAAAQRVELAGREPQRG